MSRLRQSASRLGLTNARTYLASGNLLFSSVEQDSLALESLLEERISDEMDLDTTVMVRRPDELTAAVATNPFQAPESELQIAFRKDRSASPDGPRLAELAARVAPDEFAVGPGDVHLHYPNGQARSKLTATALERGLGTPVTVRGIRTVKGIRADRPCRVEPVDGTAPRTDQPEGRRWTPARGPNGGSCPHPSRTGRAPGRRCD